MKKMEVDGLNEVAISLAAIKAVDVGDELVVMDDTGQVAWFTVETREAKRGRGVGGTTLGLKDLSTGDVTFQTFTNALPAGVVRVRRVSAGVNLRTLRKAPAPTVKAKDLVTQPVGEFENILDVPDLDGDSADDVIAPELLAPVPMVDAEMDAAEPLVASETEVAKEAV